MIGFHAKKDYWFCDLQCYGCQGAYHNVCILVGMFSLAKAQDVSFEQEVFLYEFMQPKDNCYWQKRVVGIPQDFPIGNFPTYDFEKVH